MKEITPPDQPLLSRTWSSASGVGSVEGKGGRSGSYYDLLATKSSSRAMRLKSMSTSSNLPNVEAEDNKSKLNISPIASRIRPPRVIIYEQ